MAPTALRGRHRGGVLLPTPIGSRDERPGHGLGSGMLTVGRSLRGNPRRRGMADLPERLLGHNDPGDDVAKHATAAEEHQHDPQNPNQCGVQIQVFCKPRTNTCYLPVDPRALERFSGCGRREQRRPALATEVDSLDILSSTLWAEHGLASRVGVIFNVQYVSLGTKVPALIPFPQANGPMHFLSDGQEKYAREFNFEVIFHSI